MCVPLQSSLHRSFPFLLLVILKLLQGNALACISKFGFKAEWSCWVTEHMHVELYKMLLNSFPGGHIPLHIHQNGAVHVKSLLGLSIVSPQKCKYFSAYSAVFFMVLMHIFLVSSGTNNRFCGLAI